jgi:hypothetical protein
MALLRWIVRIVAVVVVLFVMVFMGARMHDGPLGPIPGGPLEAGELVGEPVPSWSFVKDVGEVELQLESQARSRTTWIFLLGDKAYVPCSLGFPPGKRWHEDAAADGRAVLRIEGKRYPVTLTRLDDAVVREMGEAVRAELTRKYGELPPSESGAWIFEVASR